MRIDGMTVISARRTTWRPHDDSQLRALSVIGRAIVKLADEFANYESRDVLVVASTLHRNIGDRFALVTDESGDVFLVPMEPDPVDARSK